MTRLFKPTLAIVALLFLVLLGNLGATVGGEIETAVTPNEDNKSEGLSETLVEIDSHAEASEANRTVIPRKTTPTPATIKRSPWQDYPNHCETFRVVESTRKVKNKHGEMVYPIRYRRLRFKRSNKDTRRTAELVRMVAKEMGANTAGQHLVEMIAAHESSKNSEAIHILNRDLEANSDAWRKHSYHASTEAALERQLETLDARGKKFWGVKARLGDIRLYKGNPHWDDELEYTYRIPEREHRGEKFPESEWQEQRSVWAFGYGLYGMNAVLYTHLWDRQAPPWVLCGDEGIIATITIVWALRNQQAECENLTAKDAERWGSDGGTARGVVRRFARGKCSDAKLGPAWRKLMATAHYDNAIDWDAKPSFGTKFDRYETHMRGGKRRYTKDEKGKRIRSDREAILAHMRAKAEAKGLLRPEPLERKYPDSEPKVRSRNRTIAVVTQK